MRKESKIIKSNILLTFISLIILVLMSLVYWPAKEWWLFITVIFIAATFGWNCAMTVKRRF